MPKECIWYVDPTGDQNTNKLMAESLGIEVKESECYEQNCGGNALHELWRCPNHEFVERFIKFARQNGLTFMIYRRKGKHGQIELWRFGNPGVVPGNCGHQRRSSVKSLMTEAADLIGMP